MSMEHLETPDYLPRRFAGKILRRQEIDLDEEEFRKQLSLGNFAAIPSIIRTLFSSCCNRCGNQKPALFAKIPCQICRQEHLYCRKCIEMGRVMECEPLYYWSGRPLIWPAISEPCSWKGDLTNRQRLAADTITDAVLQNQQELLVWAVCGAGKTEMIFPGIAAALQTEKRVCLATPRADVVRELVPRFRQAFPTITIQGLYGGSEENEGTAQLILATTHQLLRYRHAFDMMVIDEVDAFPFHADASLPFAADRAKCPNGTTIYLTATPRKNQQIQMLRKKLPHIFVPVRFHGHPLPVPLQKICITLKKELARPAMPAVLQKWMHHRKNANRQLLLFVPTIEFAEKLAAKLASDQGGEEEKSVCYVHASDPEREEKVKQFRERKIMILVTTTILERGVTFPSVDVVVLDAGHAVFDEAALVQIAGRAGRSTNDPNGDVLFLHDGKTEAIVTAIKSIQAMNRRGGFT